MRQRWRRLTGVIGATCGLAALLACGHATPIGGPYDVFADAGMPARTRGVDTVSLLSPRLRADGGPVAVELTARPTERALAILASRGLQPPLGRLQLTPFLSAPTFVAGTLAAGHLSTLAAVAFVVSIQSTDLNTPTVSAVSALAAPTMLPNKSLLLTPQTRMVGCAVCVSAAIY